MPTFVISGHSFSLERRTIERALAKELPDPLTEHYVVVHGRRFPPKQVLAKVTGLDRADFTTHQARRILKRLGFVAERVGSTTSAPDRGAPDGGPFGGRQAAALAPYAGQWVALGKPTEVLVAADSPEDVLAWLSRHERRASGGMFRVPLSADEAQGAAPT
ncbi:MAG: hypothetical protein FJW96_05060 [Actinobacteria bacterium]|nr:hypothetical protein [Actinomycetota bacterium]